MKQTKAIKYAYIAGLIDGEGCININGHKKNGVENNCYDLRVQIRMCDGLPLDYVKGIFGGTIIKRKTTRENWTDSYQYSISTQQAAKMLKNLLPFLKTKKLQAQIALEFQYYKNSHNERGIRRLPHQISKEMMYVKKLQDEKKNLNIPKSLFAAAETKWNNAKNGEAIVQSLENQNLRGN